MRAIWDSYSDLLKSQFLPFSHSALQRIDKKEVYLNSLPEYQQEMLTNYRLQLLRSRRCIEANHQIISAMIEDVHNLFEEEPEADNSYHRIHKNLKSVAGAENSFFHQKLDTERVIITLKQIIRDWSVEGEEERRSCYGPILEAISEEFKDM